MMGIGIGATKFKGYFYCFAIKLNGLHCGLYFLSWGTSKGKPIQDHHLWQVFSTLWESWDSRAERVNLVSSPNAKVRTPWGSSYQHEAAELIGGRARSTLQDS